MTIKEALFWAENELKERAVNEPKKSAQLLLGHVLNFDNTQIITHYNDEITARDKGKFKDLISRRMNFEPVWQIIGKVKFWRHDFFINSDVLVPRPETEFLVKEVLIEAKKSNKGLKILDIGTGSGAIICSLKKEIQGSLCFASDISEKALKVARKNATNLNVEISFKNGKLFKPWAGKKFDIITANLPYIPHEEMNNLAIDLTHYEPRIALDGGENGLEIYEQFLREIKKYLEKNATIFCEIGIKQGKAFKALVKKYLPKSSIEILTDFAKIDRIVIIKFKEEK